MWTVREKSVVEGMHGRPWEGRKAVFAAAF